LKNKFLNLLSYFKDVSLETSQSQYNPHLEVLLVESRHQLVTKDAIYSFDDKYENFYRTFKAINWEKLNAKNVLVLGLGLGSVIYMLEKKLNLHFKYTCLEIDPEIVRLAQKYTLDYIESQVEIYNTDAYNYVNINESKFDLILMDIFQSSIIPHKFQSPEFLDKLKTSLTDGGLLLYNRMNINEADKFDNTLFNESFHQAFPNGKILTVKDNIVLVSNRNYLL
jgi:spermidine synthase